MNKYYLEKIIVEYLNGKRCISMKQNFLLFLKIYVVLNFLYEDKKNEANKYIAITKNTILMKLFKLLKRKKFFF